MDAAVLPVEEYIATLRPHARELARHVLLGAFNKGRPVGFHHAPNGVCPPGRRIDEILERFPDGSYTAVVSFYDPKKNRWVQKGAGRQQHTMFPDDWSRDEVMAAGRDAYRARMNRVVERWKSRGRGLSISGYRRADGRGPATFFPERKP